MRRRVEPGQRTSTVAAPSKPRPLRLGHKGRGKQDAAVLERNEPAEPRALLWLRGCTVWFGRETVLDPQRP
jgi:hypothetical protein